MELAVRVVGRDRMVRPVGWKPNIPSGYEILDTEEGFAVWDPEADDDRYDVLVLSCKESVGTGAIVDPSMVVWETLDGEEYMGVSVKEFVT